MNRSTRDFDLPDFDEDFDEGFDAALDALRAELDDRGAQDEPFWQEQLRAIRLGRSDDDGVRTPRLRAGWALAAGAALLLVTVALGFRALDLPPIDDVAGSGIYSVDSSTSELLRSVEITLASDAAPSLSAADLLLAELEQEYTAATKPP